MSTRVWPPIAPHKRIEKEEESLARELEWLLSSLQETFASLKAGLEECAALLSPDKGPSTLVLSSQRSESLKGYVTRIGTRIVKGDITLRLPTLGPPPKGQSFHRLTISSAPQAPILVLDQLTTVRTLINTSLDIIDISRWTGDAKNAQFIAGQLRLLCENMLEAKKGLKGAAMEGLDSGRVQKRDDGGSRKEEELDAGTADDEEQSDGERRGKGHDWWDDPVDQMVFEPPLPPNLSFHLSISDAALILHIRTLGPASDHNPDSLRERFASALGGARAHYHDEINKTYTYKGREVVVKQKLKVESQDPALLSAMAKLSALEHGAAMSRRALSTVMGVEE